MPLVSVSLATNRDPSFVEACLRTLAAQDCCPERLEVFVVFNGTPVPTDWPRADWPFTLHTRHRPEANLPAARNVALAEARGEYMLMLNDDVLLAPQCVSAHLAAHQRTRDEALVLGLADWKRIEDETVFDRMIQTTSMIFFYDQLQPHTWSSYRHAWTLNLSFARRYVARLRYAEPLAPFFFEDLELAFRLERLYNLNVWYEPAALAFHDHRYTLDGYLEREYRLGAASLRLWRTNAECFRQTYGTALDSTWLGYCRDFIRHEGRRERDLYDTLHAVTGRPTADFPADPDALADLIRGLYQAHLPLKRLAFRRGLLDAVRHEAETQLPAAAATPPGATALERC